MKHQNHQRMEEHAWQHGREPMRKPFLAQPSAVDTKIHIYYIHIIYFCLRVHVLNNAESTSQEKTMKYKKSHDK